jgi:carbonic anhydrase
VDQLVRGTRRFRRDVFPAKQTLFGKLADGQAPLVLFVTCSDSRVVPHLVTGSEPGDLFVIRNAGNLIPPFDAAPGGEQATVEFAVSVLGVRHIVVCGHSDCGAMKGVLAPDSLTRVPSVARWLELARPAGQVVDATGGSDLDPSERLARTIEVNALRQLDNLRTHPSVAAALAQGKLTLHAWIYHIGTGAVTCYDDERGRYVDLDEADDALDRSHSQTSAV